jgi:hypothetical protein
VAVTTKGVNVALLVGVAGALVGVAVATVGVSVDAIVGDASDGSVAVTVVTVPVSGRVVVIDPAASAKTRLGTTKSATACSGRCAKSRKSPHNASKRINQNFFIYTLSLNLHAV